MSRGTFIAVVGPSGAGKDTVIAGAMAKRADLLLARRVISRPPSPDTEDYDSVTTAEFAQRCAAGAFALHWRAHGLDYGIPISVTADLASGRHVIANLSRTVIPAARAAFQPFLCCVVTAEADVLATRLVARGREDAADIARRLARAADPSPQGVDVRIIDNSGQLEQAINTFLGALPPVQPVSA
ncbi:MAG: phosphonate metabolism protein/1,5-bisphosphokinase (PRPP-forming) PhnN [Pseudomonadota bacterium]